MSLMKKNDFQFYNIRKTIKAYPNAYYYMIYGERSNGKTYSALDYAMEQYKKNGSQFAYIRRWGEDIRRKNLSTLFDGHATNGRISEVFGGEWSSVNYTGNRFYLQTIVDDEKVQDPEPMGFAFDLNSMEHHKSTSYPKVTTIIFDEFMSRNGYIPNEWVLFTNTLSTIIRLRDDVKIFMLGNTVNKYCPYFEDMGIKHIREQKPGTIDVYTYAESGLEVVCEYTDPSTKRGGKASDVYFAFDNPELKMITGGAWEISIYPHLRDGVKIQRKEIVASFFIVFNGEIIQGDIVSQDSGNFIFFHAKTTPIQNEDKDFIYGTEPDERKNHFMGISKQSDKLSRYINKALRENRVFYSTNEIGEVVRNYVMWSESYSIKN